VRILVSNSITNISDVSLNQSINQSIIFLKVASATNSCYKDHRVNKKHFSLHLNMNSYGKEVTSNDKLFHFMSRLCLS